MIGTTTFTFLTWGSIVLVGVVFAYEMYAVLLEQEII